MATQTLTLYSSLVVPNSHNLTKAVAGPCSVFILQKKKSNVAVRAQAAGEKDESVDVHVTKNNTQGSGSGTAVERRARRLGVDSSPFDVASSNPPLVCLVRFAGDSAAGAVMGSIFGFGSGLFKKQGIKGSFAEAGTSAKTFAVLSGVHSLVVCFLKRLRGKDDVLNAGVAGCCTGLALSFPGAPQALLQSCLTFGAFSFIIEGLNKQQPALALSSSSRTGSNHHQGVLPPLTLPLPSELKDSFSSFCQSITNRNNKGSSGASP